MCGPCVGVREVCCECCVTCTCVSVFAYHRVVISCLLKHDGGKKTTILLIGLIESSKAMLFSVFLVFDVTHE